jgi:hypothetical protein
VPLEPASGLVAVEPAAGPDVVVTRRSA